MTATRRRNRSAYHRDLMASYYAAREAQEAEAEALAVGYASELANYYAEHPRVTFRRWLTEYAEAMGYRSADA